ncbi:MAG: hypothetical protein HUU38_14950 [Anaerolineales bacterium]|nr:hypothetical protein [Anaerolineales bacterium]
MYELYLRHYAGNGTLKNAALEPLWARWVEGVNEEGRLTFAINAIHPAADDLVELDLIEVLIRNKSLGIVDFTRAFLSILRDVSIETDPDLITTLTFTCPGENHPLAWRHVLWPAATPNRSIFDSVPAETIMKTVVQYNCTADASVANERWREGDLSVAPPSGMGVDISIATDQARGETLSVSLMGGNVLGVLQRLAAQGGGDFQLRWQGGDAWEFEFYESQLGADKSSGTTRVLFSLANGTLLNPRLQVIGAGATSAISAGQGEEDEREVSPVTGVDYATNYDIETFVDARNAETAAERLFQGQARLHELRRQQILEFDVAQTGDIFWCPVPITGRKTYRLGDLALVDYHGSTQTRKITRVHVDWRVPQSESNFIVALETQEV